MGEKVVKILNSGKHYTTVIVRASNQLIDKSATDVLKQILSVKNVERRDSSIVTCKTQYTADETWSELELRKLLICKPVSHQKDS